MVHKQGSKAVSDQRLLRRNGVYYYRRRVPLSLTEKIGKRVIQVSLQTTSFNEAKKLRTLRDLEWDARFEMSAAIASSDGASAPSQVGPLDESALLQLVRDY